MDPLVTLLTQLGISIGAEAIYDVAKGILRRGGRQTEFELAEALSQEFPALSIQRAQAVAETVIKVFAEHGLIDIRGSDFYAKDEIRMDSALGGTLAFGDRSSSVTDKSSIEAGGGAFIKARDGAGWRQNSDGSIEFYTRG